MIILHGDHQLASRNALRELIDKAKQEGMKEIVRLDGEKLKLEELKQAMESKSLFASGRLVVIENLLTRTRSKAKDELTQYLAKENPKSDVLLWEKKAATPRELQKFPKETRIRLFKISPAIFRFLDSVFPGNVGQMLFLYHESLKQENPEFIFYMLCRRVASLISVADYGRNGLKGLQQWQRQRLERQAKKFDLQTLVNLHETLYAADRAIKTGKNIISLSSMLDLLLFDI